MENIFRLQKGTTKCDFSWTFTMHKYEMVS